MSVPVTALVPDQNPSIIEGSPESQSSKPKPPAWADLYRQIFVSLDLSLEVGPVIGFSSAIAGEGRTTIATGLALTLASDLEAIILLVDANLDRPSLHSHLDIPLEPGLADVLRGEMALEDVMYNMAENLFVVPSGTAGDDASRLLWQFSQADLFATMREEGVVTILDLPPLLTNSYSSLAASVADALVLVVRAGTTPTGVVSEALARAGTIPVGIVLNGQQVARPPWRLRRRRR